jgi:hypothetical protein
MTLHRINHINDRMNMSQILLTEFCAKTYYSDAINKMKID